MDRKIELLSNEQIQAIKYESHGISIDIRLDKTMGLLVKYYQYDELLFYYLRKPNTTKIDLFSYHYLNPEDAVEDMLIAKDIFYDINLN